MTLRPAEGFLLVPIPNSSCPTSREVEPVSSSSSVPVVRYRRRRGSGGSNSMICADGLLVSLANKRMQWTYKHLTGMLLSSLKMISRWGTSIGSVVVVVPMIDRAGYCSECSSSYYQPLSHVVAHPFLDYRDHNNHILYSQTNYRSLIPSEPALRPEDTRC